MEDWFSPFRVLRSAVSHITHVLARFLLHSAARTPLWRYWVPRASVCFDPSAPVSLNAIAAIRDETTGLAVVVGDSGRFILWQGEDKFQTATVALAASRVSVSPDGTWAAVGDVEGRVLCVDVLSGRGWRT